jgi:hypothetical protein
MASTRATAIRLREQESIIVAYERLHKIVEDTACRRKYLKKIKAAQQEAAALRRRLAEKKKSRSKRPNNSHHHHKTEGGISQCHGAKS